MYYPILRGKQNELLALRELVEANVLGNYTPIIEPVKNNFSSLIKAIEELNKKGIEPVVIVNPDKGDFKKSNPILSYKNIQNEKGNLSFLPCINYQDPRAADIIKGLSRYSIISNGASQELVQASHTAEKTIIKADVSPVILEEMKNVILFDDFFQSQDKNANYPSESKFTGIHTYYKKSPNVIGFGDYTITGSEFTESGGPAYVVAIHLSYIDDKRYHEKYIRHYLSFDDKTSKKGPDKFRYALNILINEVNSKQFNFIESNGIAGFRDLNHKQHFPGLGQVKKLSIMHHIETFNDYLSH
ncbi:MULTISPECIES: sce7725 family protein [Acinetobacter calcoaceticus/baumannii complex]|uniref:sce7725 family protein n=1 Tax=Acinetobacter calcoaceticus/baumannii complex TaxID=909768 RepID=UPI0020C08AEB|nr:sce7725 family protein [Acinetobacter baumannii]MCL6166203.1 sce7725 family protein [Acinetobacter baumannii]MCL6168882.1 sce7725 family protein [Acinetobacter baumannii]MCL6171458.1 sce7725 family protein [Acinetobacter baumannii]MCL6175170.1 sce7725 family protein [Acinetobacter baumannii]MCL6179892.1 sce7725 family protein [Acinetobacter baumannii]